MPITQRVTDLVIELFEQGYSGTASFSKGDYSGAMDLLKGQYAIALTGFCKETLHIYEDDRGMMVCVGRYSLEMCGETLSVADIVGLAWSMYKQYRERGYGIPAQFVELFEKSGRIKKKVQTVESWDEI